MKPPSIANNRMKTGSHRIVGSGLFALDIVVRTDGMVLPPALGGSAGNVLSILGAMGWKPTPVGTLGDDFAAKIVRRDFAKVKADLRFIQPSAERDTPVVYQHQMPSQNDRTHRFSFACPNCGTRRAPHWDEEGLTAAACSALPKASVFFFDRPTLLGVALAEYHKQSGALVVFEPSAIGDDQNLFARAVRSSHIIKYADDRISCLAAFDLQSVLVEIQTCGADGLRFRAPSIANRWMRLGAYNLPYVQDTAGSGDWCTAGMIFDLFDGGANPKMITDHNILTRALTFGQALSTLNCMTEGARGLLATWSPSRIIRSARELSTLRLNTHCVKSLQLSTRVSELCLEALAYDASQRTTMARSDAGSLPCCPTF
ncbi:hypothetical protein HMI48_00910 [Acidithiobacillus ferrooxidans]|uniref:hypothetical protein n=1 Tax=Acidithiobacillus ferrooxidans TaxID=920 RepID=UPI001C076274|nr:hypothetical protein [Acidithiobacillus ferrooxidans]MBU2772522.1 hypothetical protein [Acidithiobacillus ferrooxidans]